MKIIIVLVMLTFFLTGCSNQSTKEPDNVGNYSIQNLSLSKENSKPQNAELIETTLLRLVQKFLNQTQTGKPILLLHAKP